jgi:prevent-host-death family protein
MVVRMGAREARQRFSELLGRVRYGGETVILESSGKPMAAVIPVETYEKMMEEREAKFDAFQRSIEDRPRVSEPEAEADIADAVASVRGNRAQGRT